jgi:hypothetical protein
MAKVNMHYLKEDPPKHTPGPWLIADDGTIEARHTGLVGYIRGASDADTILVEAAPELLFALKNLLRTFAECNTPHDHDQWVQFVHAAQDIVAKVEGRS